MVIHAALVAKKAQEFAGALPFVLAGDFNIQPDSSPYQLLLDGSLPEGHPHAPPPRSYDPWSPSLKAPLQSAYVLSGKARCYDHTLPSPPL